MHGVVPGLAAGALLSLAAARGLRAWLAEVTRMDPVALTVALLLLATVGVLASLLPARRATRVDPLVAMRAE
jgi:ABC-type antimicrobial peptide transport system permease subunit